jgi:hypothetical protein
MLIVSWSEAGALFTVGKPSFISRTVMVFEKRKRVANGHYRNRMKISLQQIEIVALPPREAHNF